MNPERQESAGQGRFFITRPDGTQVEIEGVEATITPHTEPYPSIEEALAQLGEIQAPAEPVVEAPAAIEEPVVELTDFERLMNSFADVEEGTVYSTNVSRAIELIAGAENLQQALQALRDNRGMDFKHLLFRQIDEETRDLNRFMEELQYVPSLPSLDVDFI